MKALLKQHCPSAVIAAGRIRIKFSRIFSLLKDSAKPRNLKEIYEFKRLARAQARLSSQRITTFRSHEYDKVMIIGIKSYNIGLFGYLLFALNQLAYCEERKYFPVVYFGKRAGDGRNDFYDFRYGSNMWEYFFEPVAGLTYEDVISMVGAPQSPLKQEQLVELSAEELYQLHFYNPASVFPYPYGFYYSKTDYDPEWYKVQRGKANALIKKYIRIKEPIQREINQFYERHMQHAFIVGVHVRGTDKATNVANPKAMRIVEPADYFDKLDPLIGKYPACKILVATDQEQYLDNFKARYGERIIHSNAIRSKTKLNVFQKRNLNGYRLGKDVLVEAQLLSRCQYFLKCTSTVGEAVLWFNPELEHIDLNYVV